MPKARGGRTERHRFAYAFDSSLISLQSQRMCQSTRVAGVPPLGERMLGKSCGNRKHAGLWIRRPQLARIDVEPPAVQREIAPFLPVLNPRIGPEVCE